MYLQEDQKRSSATLTIVARRGTENARSRADPGVKEINNMLLHDAGYQRIISKGWLNDVSPFAGGKNLRRSLIRGRIGLQS